MCALMQLANLGVRGLPKGPLAACAVCAKAGMECPLHSICLDFNFALSHLFRCGSADIQLAPPNQMLYLHFATYAALLVLNPSSAAAGDAAAALACSDFNAATSLARTSEKVCTTCCLL